MYYRFMYILGAGKDPESLFNIFVVIVLAIFWIGGFILKALSQKSGKEEGAEGEDKSTGLEEIKKMFDISKAQPRRSEGRIEDMQESVSETPAEEKMVREVKDKIKAGKGGGRSLSKGVKGGPEVSAKVFEKDEELPGIDTEQSGIYKGAEKEAKGVEESESLAEQLDIEGPEDLRTAILHYEILGKPVSERS